MNHLTPMQRVLQRIPTAYARLGCGHNAGLWFIADLVCGTNAWSNYHKTGRAAWADAAKRLPAPPEEPSHDQR